MNLTKHTLHTLAPAVALVLTLSACQPSAEQDAGSGASSDRAGESADAAPTNPGILDEPMDGSSVEAFEADMDAVREQAGQAAFVRLRGSIDYMLTYDLGLKRDRAKLYKRLDGKTPNDIIAMSRRD